MSIIEIFTKNEKETRKLGEILGKEILKFSLPKKALVIALKGNLGSGKTTFLKGLAKGLGIKEKILSPTFIIIKKFNVKKLKFKNFYHIDCYRIHNTREILSLGFKEIIENPYNIVAIEWAERIKKIIPKNTVWIIFEILDKNERKIKIQ